MSSNRISRLRRRLDSFLSQGGSDRSKASPDRHRRHKKLALETLENRRLLAVTTAVGSGDWHDASTWDNGVPDATSRAIISTGNTVSLSGVNHVAEEIVVHGTLQATEGLLDDGGFENPVQPDNAFELNNGNGMGDLTGTQWELTANAGISRDGSPYQNGGVLAPQGEQIGVIKIRGSFSQQLTGLVPGQEYDVSLLTRRRVGYAGGTDLKVSLIGGASTINVIDIPEVTHNVFTLESGTFIATQDSYELRIEGDRNAAGLSGDRTTFIDDVRVQPIGGGSGEPKTLTADWIHVNSGGLFEIGSVTDRFDTDEIVITLTGSNANADHVIETATGTMNVMNNDGFLMTAMGGQVSFYGDEKPSFTKLAETADIGDTTITVENIIERNFDGITNAVSDGEVNWEVGDQIVIASSSYDYNEEDVRTITAVNNTGSQTTFNLDTPLSYRHYGEVETYGNGTRDWDLDLRAEVALLNRSITIQGTQDTDNQFGDRANYGTGSGENLGIGAHAMFMDGSGTITIDGVRFDKMGQTATLGRYPVHWHVGGDRTGDVLRNSSITNSNNRGVTLHGVQGVRVEGNVLHDIHGHGFFMEDAAETGNEFLHNIALGIHKVGGDTRFDANDPFIVPGITRANGGNGPVNGVAERDENVEGSHDIGQNVSTRFIHSSAYWITNPDNTWVGNISAGSEGTGFWFALPDEVIGLSKDTGLYNGLNPQQTNLLQFDHNFSHSAPIGLTFDRGQDILPGSSSLYRPPSAFVINHFTGYKHIGAGSYNRAPEGIFNESRWADNTNSSFNTFEQEEHNVLFVGHSRGNADYDQLVSGYRLYDGPGAIKDSHFAGFADDDAYTFVVEGATIKFASTEASGISLENDGTRDHLSINHRSARTSRGLTVDETPNFVAGRPDQFSGIVLDTDGSLTGHAGGGPGHVLTPMLNYYRDSTDIAPDNWEAYISDDKFAFFGIGVVDNSPAFALMDGGGRFGTDGVYIPEYRLSNGDGHSIVANSWNRTFFQRQYVKVNAGDYKLEFTKRLPEDGFDIALQTARGGAAGESTVFQFVNVGTTHRPTIGAAVSSLANLRSASQTSYFVASNGDLWMNVFPTGDDIQSSLTIPIDRVNPDPVVPNVVADGGFENPEQLVNTFELATGSGQGTLNGSEWVFTGNAGINRTASNFQTTPIGGKVPAPQGVQNAMIRNSGSMSQTISGLEVGQTYELSLWTMGRQTGGGGIDLAATLDPATPDENQLIYIDHVSYDQFTKVRGTFVATKSDYVLMIDADRVRSGRPADSMTFVDDVQIDKAPDTIPILDSGFETAVQPKGQFGLNNGNGDGDVIGTEWELSGSAGISRNGSGYQNGGVLAAQGEQIGLIKISGSFSQQLTGFVPGQYYDVSLLTRARVGYGGGTDLKVSLIGGSGPGSDIVVIDIPEVTHDVFTLESGRFLATQDSYELRIEGDRSAAGLTGDRTTFIDAVQVHKAADTIPVLDSGFENPVQPDNAFELDSGSGSGDLTGTLWQLTANAGISRNGSAYQNGGVLAAEGEQIGLIKIRGSFSQLLTGFIPGRYYDVSLLTRARQGFAGGTDLKVSLIGGGSTTDVINIPEVTHNVFTRESGRFLATQNSYELRIEGDRNAAGLSGDRTTFIDDVRVREVSGSSDPIAVAVGPSTLGSPVGDEIASAADVPSALIDETLAIWGLASHPEFDIAVADLGGSVLGRVIGNTIYLDDDAAGHGWFIDPTPATDNEFGGGGAAAGKVDLLTVLANEIGQLNDETNDLVASQIQVGVRHR